MIFLIILLIIILIFLSKHLLKPKIRGIIGEKKVEWTIDSVIGSEQYVINNLILSNNGTTSQIDHIVINPRGVFVLETKNYSGEIYGSEDQREWTQVLSYGKVKNKLYNPVKQNATHAYIVRQIIGNLPIRPYVVFTQNNTGHISSDKVVPLCSLKNRLQYGENVLTAAQMRKAYETLLSRKTNISTQEHIKNIRAQQQNIENGICPRCGGNLVLRNGKHGSFYGCSNYPKCKFIKK